VVGKGLGRALLRDALVRVAAASEEIAARTLLVHCEDDGARRFYERFGEFEPSPADPLHISLLMSDLRRTLAPPQSGFRRGVGFRRGRGYWRATPRDMRQQAR
jgi:ribosomal protein S18 acetylase RimI-like enzyme